MTAHVPALHGVLCTPLYTTLAVPGNERHYPRPCRLFHAVAVGTRAGQGSAGRNERDLASVVRRTWYRSPGRIVTGPVCGTSLRARRRATMFRLPRRAMSEG